MAGTNVPVSEPDRHVPSHEVTTCPMFRDLRLEYTSDTVVRILLPSITGAGSVIVGTSVRTTV